jgi:hypothetical protein
MGTERERIRLQAASVAYWRAEGEAGCHSTIVEGLAERVLDAALAFGEAMAADPAYRAAGAEDGGEQ